MSSKAGITIVLIILLFFCLIAAAVGVFLGWRHYQNGNQAATVTDVNAPPPSPLKATPPPTRPRAVTPKETSHAGRRAATATPSSTHHIASGTSASSRSSQPSAPPSSSSTPPYTPSSKKNTTSAEGAESGINIPPVNPVPEESVPTTPKKVKGPHGQLGLIFESRIDEGKLSILVDGDSLVGQSYTASSSSPFRLTKQVKMSVGQHFVKVTIETPNGKTYDKSWNVMIQRKAVAVWKIQMNRFPKKITIKHIQ